MKSLFSLIAISVILFGCKKNENVLGCTDETATNYNPSANVSDGSCVHPVDTTSFTLRSLNIESPAYDYNGLLLEIDLYELDNLSSTVAELTSSTQNEWYPVSTSLEHNVKYRAYVFMGDGATMLGYFDFKVTGSSGVYTLSETLYYVPFDTKCGLSATLSGTEISLTVRV